MNASWMETPLWGFVVAALPFSLFFIYFWCMGSWFEALGKYRKDVPQFIYGMFFDKKSPVEKRDSPEDVALSMWIVRGIAIIIGIGFFIGFQLSLWVDYAGEHVTLDRTLLVQPLMFLPFLLFNYLGVHFFQRYLNKLPERKDVLKE